MPLRRRAVATPRVRDVATTCCWRSFWRPRRPLSELPEPSGIAVALQCRLGEPQSSFLEGVVANRSVVILGSRPSCILFTPPSVPQLEIVAKTALRHSWMAVVVHLTYIPQSVPQGGIVTQKARRHSWVGDAVYLTCITPSLLQEGLLANMARCDSSLAAVVYLTYMPQSMPQEAIVATTARRHFWVTPSCFLWVMSASRVGALPPK